MNTPSTKHTDLKDGWTHDPDYRRRYQTAEDIKQALDRLTLDGASGLADIGCGNGAFAIAAAQKHPGCQVWAFDALESAVAECRTQGAGLANLHEWSIKGYWVRIIAEKRPEITSRHGSQL